MCITNAQNKVHKWCDCVHWGDHQYIGLLAAYTAPWSTINKLYIQRDFSLLLLMSIMQANLLAMTIKAKKKKAVCLFYLLSHNVLACHTCIINTVKTIKRPTLNNSRSNSVQYSIRPVYYITFLHKVLWLHVGLGGMCSGGKHMQ